MRKRLPVTFFRLFVSGTFLFSAFEVNAQAIDKKAKDTIVIQLHKDSLQKSLHSFTTLNQVPLQQVNAQPYISLQQVIKGNLAGVYVQEPSGEPGTEQNIFIRGISSPLLSKRELFNQQAAIFLNGIPLTQDNPFAYEIQKYDFNRIGPATNLLAAINADNIESIRIIKDPATLATLGPVAVNGAIWITTKNAQAGSRDICINGYYGYSLKPAITPVNAAYENNFRKPFYDRFASINDRLNYPPYLRDSTNIDYYGPANWKDVYYNTTPLYNVDMSISGGTDRANFRFFGGATKNAGSADHTALNRYTGSFFINAAPLKWFMVSSMISYNRLERKRNRNIRDRLAEERYLPDLTNPLTPNKTLYNSYLAEFDKAIDDNTSNVLQGYISATAKFKQFHYTSQIGFDYTEGIREVFWPTTLLEGNNFVSNYFGYNQRVIISNTLGYDLRISDNQRLTLEAAQSFMADTYKYDYAYAYNGPNDFVKINVVDPANLQPTGFRVYYFPSKMQSALASFSGTAKYTLNDLLTLSMIVRRDGSSNMQPDHRWMTNYAASAEWDLKKHLVAGHSGINELSATLGWARLGKLLSDDRFNAGPQYRVDLGWGNEPTLGSYAGIPGISRPYTSGWVGYNIPWAYSDQLNLALRTTILHNRLKAGLDVYNRNDKQMMLPMPVPAEWGYTGAYQPGLQVTNRGVDLNITAEIIAKSANGISWQVNANGNYNKNKLTGLPGGIHELVIGNNKLVVGQPVDAFWVYKNQGTYVSGAEIPVDPATNKPLSYQGIALKAGDPKWQDVNGDYVINEKDKVLQGNYLPRVTGGFGSSLGYKAFSLDLQFYFALGRKVMNQYAAQRLDFINTDAVNNINSVKEITFWEKKKDLSSYPMYNPWSPIVPYRPDQDLFIDNAAFLKLRSITCNYSLPVSKSKSSTLKNGVLYITATNLFTLTPFKGDDPELVNYNGIYTGYGMPLSRTITAGIKLNL